MENVEAEIAEQRGDGVLHQRALSEGLRGLRAGHIELGLRLRDIQARSDAGIVALLRETEARV